MEWPALLRKLDRHGSRATATDIAASRGERHERASYPHALRSTQPLQRCAAALALPRIAALRPGAQTSDYPTKPVRVVVAFTAGGTTDILARAVSQKLSERLKQQFVIDNKPGAGGNIGTELAARAAPDGYTLIVNSVGPIAVNPSLYKKLTINPLVDLVPIVQIADVPERAGGASVGAGEDAGGVHRVRQGQPGQAQLRLDRHRHLVAPVRLHAEPAHRRSTPCTCRTRAPTR